jgi:hypothetical protein
MTAYIPVLAALIGALVYVLSANGKAAELGRITYAAGMFALLFALGERMVKLFG